MAQRTQVILVDDIDGSEATQTVTFGIDGVTYEIDLNEEHAAALRESVEEWTAKARRVRARRTPLLLRRRRNGGDFSLESRGIGVIALLRASAPGPVSFAARDRRHMLEPRAGG